MEGVYILVPLAAARSASFSSLEQLGDIYVASGQTR
jgi:hypothetical protein